MWSYTNFYQHCNVTRIQQNHLPTSLQILRMVICLTYCVLIHMLKLQLNLSRVNSLFAHNCTHRLPRTVSHQPSFIS